MRCLFTNVTSVAVALRQKSKIILMIRQIFLRAVFVFLLYGCLSVSAIADKDFVFTSYSKATYPPKPDNYPIKLFFLDKPQGPYEILGDITASEIKDVNTELKMKARQVGGDGVIDIQIDKEIKTIPTDLEVKPANYPGEIAPVYTPGYSYQVYNVKGKVIRFKK